MHCTRRTAMSLTPDEIKKIAHLARLSLSNEEVNTLSSQLNNILAFTEQMNEIDTTGIAPLSHALDVTQRLREDKVTETNLRDKYQEIAPQTEAGLYLVPTVIE